MVTMVTKTNLGQHFGEVFKHIGHVKLRVKIDINLCCKVLNMTELKMRGGGWGEGGRRMRR